MTNLQILAINPNEAEALILASILGLYALGSYMFYRKDRRYEWFYPELDKVVSTQPVDDAVKNLHTYVQKKKTNMDTYDFVAYLRTLTTTQQLDALKTFVESLENTEPRPDKRCIKLIKLQCGLIDVNKQKLIKRQQKQQQNHR